MLGKSESDGPALAIYAAVVYDVISATNSSPQTTEINAKARGDTLMKWVNLGLAQAGFFMLLAFLAEPADKKWRPVVGGGIAGVLLYLQYVHARNAGERSIEPPTETYGPVA
jgi:hypothetical protein